MPEGSGCNIETIYPAKTLPDKPEGACVNSGLAGFEFGPMSRSGCPAIWLRRFYGEGEEVNRGWIRG